MYVVFYCTVSEVHTVWGEVTAYGPPVNIAMHPTEELAATMVADLTDRHGHEGRHYSYRVATGQELREHRHH